MYGSCRGVGRTLADAIVAKATITPVSHVVSGERAGCTTSALPIQAVHGNAATSAAFDNNINTVPGVDSSSEMTITVSVEIMLTMFSYETDRLLGAYWLVEKRRKQCV
jgi:hypothetical protein